MVGGREALCPDLKNMFGTGKENLKNIRVSHLRLLVDVVYEHIPDVGREDLTVNIIRESVDTYTVSWSVNDHYGGGMRVIFFGKNLSKVKEVTKIASWIF